MEKGLILIIVGIILSLTIIGAIIGLPLIIIGAYLLNKRIKNPTEEIQKEIDNKQEELDNIDETLSKMENDKKDELDKLEKDKKEHLERLETEKTRELTQLEQKRTEEIDKELSDKQTELENITEKIDTLDEKYERLCNEKEAQLNNQIKFNQDRLDSVKKKLAELDKELAIARDDTEMLEYGLYEPKYNFTNSVQYKEKLDEIRKKQKEMIKNKKAAVCYTEWEIKGSKARGKAFTNANLKQILRSFNNETTVLINKVSHSNIESIEKRIEKSYKALNKLYTREDVRITYQYYTLKLEEMHLAYEYEVKKQEEKEELREAREREKEEKKLQKELEREKKKFNKENNKITDEIAAAKEELTKAHDEERAKLEAEIAKLQAALDKNNEEIEKIDKYKETPGAGYVYIISNKGSFGEDVFKIGVTRRDNPEDRIRELSSASVPFKFDSHVFIFSEKAYDLESSLHERFDKVRVNKVNRRKEFFRISMDDVKKIVEENKGSVHSFVEHPDNEEYIDTLRIEKSQS